MSEDAWLEELSYDECLHLIRRASVGRVGIIVDGHPLVLPVNFRLVETSAARWIAIRTRPGNVIDRATTNVAFEIDETDTASREGYSVLVRGTLHHVDPDAAGFRDRYDPEPWIIEARDSWLIIDPFSITGRRLHAGDREWVFSPEAYL